MRSVEKSAKTREEAIEAALQELGASISDVEIKVLDEGSKGLFGLFGSRLARVQVTLKGSESDADDELDVMSLLQDSKPARRQEQRWPRPEKPQPAEKPQEPRPEKPVQETEVQKKPEKPRRPEPVRRVNPDKKSPEEQPAPAVQEPVSAAEAPAEADDSAEQAAPAAERKPRSRHRGGRGKGSKEPRPQQEEAKPLPPKPVMKPMEKPVVTMIPDDQLDSSSPAGKAKAFLQELTQLMGVHVEIAMGSDPEGNVYGYMTGDTLGILIGRRGETLDAVQYLTSLKVNRDQDAYTRVTLDTENYRAKREDTLIRLANRMANRAVKTGRKVALEPMNPYERRIIHSALQANEAVDTHSEGDDPNRHVVITLRR